MSTENQVSSAPETQIPASVPTETPVVVEPEATDSAAPEGDESEAKPEKTAEQKKIEELEMRERALRRQLTKRDRTQGKLYQEAQTYKQQLEQYTAQTGDVQQRSADPHEMAAEIAVVNEITKRSNAIANEGRTKFTDFDKSLETVLEEAGDLVKPNGRFTPLGEALAESEIPAALIDFLGNNPDLAASLEGLSQSQIGRRFVRFEEQMKTTTAKPVSKASEPISPIKGGAGNVVKSLDKMSMDEYVAHRQKQGARWAKR